MEATAGDTVAGYPVPGTGYLTMFDLYALIQYVFKYVTLVGGRCPNKFAVINI